MKVYTLEFVYDMEEDFGGFQQHLALEGVFSEKSSAELAAQSNPTGHYYDYQIREWDLN